MIQDTSRALPSPAPPLIHLRHLAIDIRHTLLPTPNPLLTSILSHLHNASSPPLSSFALKLSDRQNPVDLVFITQLLDLHATSLRDISFMNSPITRESIVNICRKCSHLERLQFVLPIKEIVSSYFHLTLILPVSQSFIDPIRQRPLSLVKLENNRGYELAQRDARSTSSPQLRQHSSNYGLRPVPPENRER